MVTFCCNLVVVVVILVWCCCRCWSAVTGVVVYITALPFLLLVTVVLRCSDDSYGTRVCSVDVCDYFFFAVVLPLRVDRFFVVVPLLTLRSLLFPFSRLALLDLFWALFPALFHYVAPTLMFVVRTRCVTVCYDSATLLPGDRLHTFFAPLRVWC